MALLSTQLYPFDCNIIGLNYRLIVKTPRRLWKKKQETEANLRRCIESYGLDAAQELGKVPEYIRKEAERKR